MERTALTVIVTEFKKVLEPLATKLQPENFIMFMAELGWNWPANVTADFNQLLRAVNDMINVLDVDNPPDDITEYLNLLGKIRIVTTQIHKLKTDLANIGNLPQELRNQIAERIFKYLLINYLERYQPALLAGLNFAEIVSIALPEFINNRIPYRAITINWGNFGKLFSYPGILENLYQWNNTTQPFNDEKFLTSIEEIAVALGMPAGQFNIPQQMVKDLYYPANATVNYQDYAAHKALRMPLLEIPNAELGYAELVLWLLGVPDRNNSNKTIKGFAIVPATAGEFTEEFQLSDTMQLDVSSAFNAMTAITVLPDRIDVLRPNANGNFAMRLTHERPNGKIILLGEPNSTRFEYQNMLLGLQLSYVDAKPDLHLDFALKDAAIVLENSGGDGFLQKILPQNPIRLGFDIAFGWASKKGFYIQGGANTAYKFAINKAIGPFFINEIDLELAINERQFKLTTGITGSATIGPITAVIEKIGLATGLEFGSNVSGILGSADFTSGFKLPSAVGLAINTQGIRGGGYLRIDPPNYAGAFNLSVQDLFEITVIALITTALPGGRSGFSMVLSVLAEFQPIQLGFGFALKGVGGMCGIHRSMNTTALLQVVKDHSMDNILFPTDPIANATAIFNTIGAILPPTENRHVFCLMAIITWGGSAELIEGKLGVMIELGGPLKIALLGLITAALPDKKTSLVILNMDVLGLMDFAQETFSLFASLYNSKVLSYPIEGDMALVADYSDDSSDFVLTIGGFYPGFKTNLLVNNPKRAMIRLGSGNAKISLTAYFAITTNSFQTGASLTIYASWGGIVIDGGAKFDALIQFRPFRFATSFRAWVKIEYEGFDISSVDLSLNLTGPNNYHAYGYAEIEIFGIGKKVDFDKKFGSRKDEAVPEISTFNLLKEQINDQRNISAQLPNWATTNISLKPASLELQYLDPLGAIVFSQKALPLEFYLERFAGVEPPADQRYLTMALLRDIEEIPGEAVKAKFAPAQYRNWSDAEKLSAPPFESFTSGKRWSSQFKTNNAQDITRVFESVVIEQCVKKRDLPILLAPNVMVSNLRHYFNTNRLVKNKSHKNFIEVVDSQFTLTTQNSIDGKFIQPTINNTAVNNMTFTETQDLLTTANNNDLVLRDAAFAKAA